MSSRSHHNPKWRRLCGSCRVPFVLWSPGSARERASLRPVPPGPGGFGGLAWQTLPRSPPPPCPGRSGAPHLRVLHDLRADGQRVEPLLQRRAQPSGRHAATVAAGETEGSAWRDADAAGSPGPGPPAGGRAASGPPSLLVSASRRRRRPCGTCGVPYRAPRRSEAPSFRRLPSPRF